MANGVPHGGWCPKGRKAEDGVIPPQFQLQETGSDSYSIRTLWNVCDSAGTVIFSKGGALLDGTLETAKFANETGKPLLHLVTLTAINEAAMQLKGFIREHAIAVLNIAGPRASHEPETGAFVKEVLSLALKPLGQ